MKAASDRSAELRAKHEAWRQAIAETTQALRDRPHRVSGIDGHFVGGAFVPRDRRGK